MKPTLFAARLREWARRDRHPPAIVTADGSIGYAQFCARAERCAHWLAAEGCRPTETVGVTIGDETTHLVVSVALLFLGVPQVALQTAETPEVRVARAARLGVRRLVATDPAHALPGLRLSRPPAEVLTAAPVGEACEALNDDPDASAIIVTSSGTTGEAKLLALSQRMLAIRAAVRLFRPGTRMLMLGSVEDYPAKMGRLLGLYEGVTAVLRPDAIGSFSDVPAWCERFGVDRLDVGLLQAIDLAPDPGGARRLPTGITVFVGGTRVPASLRLAYQAAGSRLLVEYGAREVSGITCTYPVDADPRQESAGIVLADVELEILDEHGERVAPGAIGEMRVRRPGMVSGYVDDPVATAARFRDGWFHTGDLARVEVPTADIVRLANDDVRTALATELRRLGFKFVTLDLDGFRSGSLNDLVPLELKTRYAK